MNWVRVIGGLALLLFWSGPAVAASLTWSANAEPDLVGYRIYQCNATPCAPSSGNQSLLVSLGKVTTYDVGTPSGTKYYYITAYDTSNLESSGSNVATFTPGSQTTSSGSPATSNVTLTVLGTPSLGQWGVEGVTTDVRDVMANIYVDGKFNWTDHATPFSFPATAANLTIANAKLGNGLHTIEFVIYLEGTTTEIGRANVTVMEGTSTTTSSSTSTSSPPPPPPAPAVTLKVVGNPTTGSWGVEGSTTDMRDVMAKIYVDGNYNWTDNDTPYSFPATTAASTIASAKLGSGSHTVQFIFYLQNTTTEIGRASITVVEGTPTPVSPVSLSVTGNPAAGNWGVAGTINDPRDVQAYIYLDGTLKSIDNTAVYSFPWDNGTGRFGAGTHTVQYVFYLQGTLTEVARSSVTVLEGP